MATTHTTAQPRVAWRVVHSESSPEWGGQEHRIMAEMRGLRQRGSTVALLTLSWSQIIRHARDEGFDTDTFSAARWQYPWAIARCARWLNRFRPHVLNTHSSRDAWIAGMAARWVRVPFVVRTRHFDVAVPNLGVSRMVYESLADHVITTSPKVSAHFCDIFGWPPERVTTLPTGVDTELYSPTGPAAELDTSNSGQMPRIGMVGVLRGAKGHDIFLRAVAQLRDKGFAARYFIVGEGPMRPMIEQTIRDFRMTDCVTLTGHRTDVPEIMRALDLLVIPSRHEGVPQVGLQALASELPVIGSDVGGIGAIIKPGQTGRLFPVGDVAAVSDTIRTALADGVSTGAMARQGRLFVQRNHSLEAMLDRLEALYVRHVTACSRG
jgi:glycosyltransferase involved in cell wall biosynthesis